MRDLQSLGLRSSDAGLYVLDQSLLPHTENWIEIRHPEDMILAVKSLQVRGAPLIGVAAALALAHYIKSGTTSSQYREAAMALRGSRPTAVNLMYAIDEMLQASEPFNAETIIERAEQLFLEDVTLCDRMAEQGQEFINDGDTILTHCNTGGLATVGVGTALGVIRKAFELGKRIHVYVDETRPLLQGGRLTTWELQKLGITYTLICDNMAASLMAQGKINSVIVGADRIATNGDFANKVGTYSLAVNAFYHRVPFFTAAPYTTVDLSCSSGKDIPIEMRRDEEVKGITAPKDASVYNPAFDVTPAELVTAWILDRKAYKLTDIQRGELCGG